MLPATVDLPGKIVPSCSESLYSTSPSLRVLKPQNSLSSEELVRFMHTPSDDSDDESALANAAQSRTLDAWASITSAKMSTNDDLLHSTLEDDDDDEVHLDPDPDYYEGPSQDDFRDSTTRLSGIGSSDPSRANPSSRLTPLQMFALRAGSSSLTVVSDTSSSRKRLVPGGRQSSQTDMFLQSSVSSDGVLDSETPPGPGEAITPPLPAAAEAKERDIAIVPSAGATLSPLASLAAAAAASATASASIAVGRRDSSSEAVTMQSPLSAMVDRATAATAHPLSSSSAAVSASSAATGADGGSGDPSPLKLAIAQAMLRNSDNVGSVSWTSSMEELSCGSSDDGRSPEEIVNARMQKRENLQQWQELVERIQEHESTITSTATATRTKPSEEIELDMMRRVSTNELTGGGTLLKNEQMMKEEHGFEDLNTSNHQRSERDATKLENKRESNSAMDHGDTEPLTPGMPVSDAHSWCVGCCYCCCCCTTATERRADQGQGCVVL